MTDTVAKRDWSASDRRGAQLHRVLIIVECLRRLNHASLADIRWNLSRNKIEVNDRTLRRDLATLTSLNWVEPGEGHDGKTAWHWKKGRA